MKILIGFIVLVVVVGYLGWIFANREMRKFFDKFDIW